MYFAREDLCGVKFVHNKEMMCFSFVHLFYVLGHMSPETQQLKIPYLSCLAITLHINVWDSSIMVFVATQTTNKVSPGL